MPVKQSSTGARILTVLEALVRNQPIGVSQLARLLEDDKSNVQRMLVTLSERGWIRAVPGRATAWRATDRLRVLADIACMGGDLRARARPLIEELRDRTGETVSLVAREGDRIMVMDVAESMQTLRMAPRVGQIVPGPLSASALALLPHLPAGLRDRLLGDAPMARAQRLIETAARDGYAAVESRHSGGSVSVAAPIPEPLGSPHAAIVLSAPATRLPSPKRARLGCMVRDIADALASG